MSGGSFDYLCHKEIDDLLNQVGLVQSMADELAGLGYAVDAARETMELCLALKQFENYAGAIKGRLQGVWRAVEWWRSGDSSEDAVKEALSEYRAWQKGFQEAAND